MALAAVALRTAEAIGDDAIVPAMREVERLGRGEKIAKPALKALYDAVDAVWMKLRKEHDPRSRKRSWLASQASGVVWMAISKEDHIDDVLRQLAYGLPGDDGDANDRQIRDWYAAALTPATKMKPRAAKISPAAKKKLELAARAIGADLPLARFDPKRTAPRARVEALIAKHGYPAHASVLEFEDRFGGIVLFEDERGHEDGLTLLGAFACLRSDGHVHPDGGRRDLVPVAYTPEDGIAFLDAAGKAYYQDTIEDEKAKAFAKDGAAAVKKLSERR